MKRCTDTFGKTQNTHITNFGRFAELFFERLAARAHKKCDLAPLFYFNSIFKLARHAWALFYTSRIFGFNFSIMSCAFSSPEALCWNTNFLHKTGIFSMRESRWPARYCTVLSSKHQIIFWRRHKIECDERWCRNFCHQNQKMIEQKNHMDPATTMHHLTEIMVDFELLWRGISKIWKTTQR